MNDLTDLTKDRKILVSFPTEARLPPPSYLTWAIFVFSIATLLLFTPYMLNQTVGNALFALVGIWLWFVGVIVGFKLYIQKQQRILWDEFNKHNLQPYGYQSVYGVHKAINKIDNRELVLSINQATKEVTVYE